MQTKTNGHQPLIQNKPKMDTIKNSRQKKLEGKRLAKDKWGKTTNKTNYRQKTKLIKDKTNKLQT